jgi:hypothetical protein
VTLRDDSNQLLNNVADNRSLFRDQDGRPAKFKGRRNIAVDVCDRTAVSSISKSSIVYIRNTLWLM